MHRLVILLLIALLGFAVTFAGMLLCVVCCVVLSVLCCILSVSDRFVRVCSAPQAEQQKENAVADANTTPAPLAYVALCVTRLFLCFLRCFVVLLQC